MSKNGIKTIKYILIFANEIMHFHVIHRFLLYISLKLVHVLHQLTFLCRFLLLS